MSNNPPKCIKCGELNSPRATHCIICGAPLQTAQHSTVEPVISPISVSPVPISTSRPNRPLKLGFSIAGVSVVVLALGYFVKKEITAVEIEHATIINTESARSRREPMTGNINSQTGKVDRRLIQAVRNGDIAAVRAFLDAGNHPDTPSTSKSRFSILMYASAANQVDIMRLLIDKGANIEYKSTDGHTPLMLAGMRGSMEAAHLLLNAGANVKTQSNSGMVALSFSVAAGKVDAVKLLLDKGSDPNNAPPNGNSELHMAAALGRFEIAKMLLAKGANPQAKDEYGSTPLDYAVKSGHDDVAQLLR